jgi:hypothetical protein
MLVLLIFRARLWKGTPFATFVCKGIDGKEYFVNLNICFCYKKIVVTNGHWQIWQSEPSVVSSVESPGSGPVLPRLVGVRVAPAADDVKVVLPIAILESILRFTLERLEKCVIKMDYYFTSITYICKKAVKILSELEFENRIYLKISGGRGKNERLVIFKVDWPDHPCLVGWKI